MSLITVDVGNSRIGAALVAGAIVEDQFDGSPEGSGPDAEKRAAEAFDWCMQEAAVRGGVEGLVLSSVVPAQTELLEAMWLAHPGLGQRPLHVVSHLSPLPFRIDVDQSHTVGADRFCNVAGAVELGHRNAIVVDLGTANTFDVLDDGVFLGGLIGPGAVTSHRALVESGARLPQTGFAWSSGLVGRNTPDAIQAGSYHQAVGAVAHVIDRLLKRFPDSSVLVTGGLAEVLGPELGDRILHLPSLTHVGAAAIGRAAAA